MAENIIRRLGSFVNGAALGALRIAWVRRLVCRYRVTSQWTMCFLWTQLDEEGKRLAWAKAQELLARQARVREAA